jgi:nitrite reductase/ring-hydroxylating ferredoxin subunit
VSAAVKEVLVAPLAEMADRDRRVIAVDGVEIGVFRIGDAIHAWQNRCPHQGGPVCQGKLMPRVEQPLGPDQAALTMRFSETTVHLVCPWHGYEFDLATGQHPGHAGTRLRRFRTLVRDGQVYVLV